MSTTQSNEAGSSLGSTVINSIAARSSSLPQGPITHGAVTSDTIMGGLQNGGDPLDFIKRNLRPTEPVKDAPATAVLPPEGDTKEDDDVAELPDAPLTEYDEYGQPIGQEPKKEAAEAPKEGEPLEEEVDLEEESPSEETPAAENFKKLRTKFRETANTLKTIKSEKERLEAELESYKNGKIVPEVLQEKENEIARLSRFEKIHNLKMSQGYQEKFIKPLGSLKEKLTSIAKDYDIPEEVLETALNFEKRSDLNRFLSQHFDELGAFEVRETLEKIKALETGAREAEKEPENILAELTKEHEKLETVRSEERLSSLKTKSQDAWVKSLNKIRSEGKIHELIFKENDPEHNEKYAKPIVTKAAQDYGKIITMLASHGLKELPDELAYALANLTQLAHASAVSIATRAAAENALNTLKTNSQRTNGMLRPQIGGAGQGGGSPLPVQAPSSPEEAGQFLLNKVLGRR